MFHRLGNTDGREFHKQLHISILFQRGANTVLARQHEIHGHSGIIVQVGKDFKLDHVKRKAVKEMLLLLLLLHFV